MGNIQSCYKRHIEDELFSSDYKTGYQRGYVQGYEARKYHEKINSNKNEKDDNYYV